MFLPNTLFVIGAGASHELGLPLGTGLKLKIASKLSFIDLQRHSGEVPLAYRQKYRAIHGLDIGAHPEFGDYETVKKNLHAWSQIERGIHFSSSVDNYLHTRRGDDRIQAAAKSAICLIIAEAESKLPKIGDRSLSGWLRRSDKDGHPTSWTQHFSEILFSGVEEDRIESALKEIKIVSFNYDRCIEKFVAIAIQSIYNVPTDRAESLASKLEVLHPYGSLEPVLKVLESRESVVISVWPCA